MKRKLVNFLYTLFFCTSIMLGVSCGDIAPTIDVNDIITTTPSTPPGSTEMTASLVFPSINARNDADIVLSFSDVVSSATLTGNLTINGSISGAHAYTGIGANSSVYSLNPTVNFSDGETVTVILSTGVQSAGGNTLYMATTATTTEFTFTIAATTTGQPSENPFVITGSQHPAPGSTVSINEGSIYIAFSKEVINVSGNYTITGSTSGALEGAAIATDVNGDGIVWELPISGSPVYGETITVELTAAITDTFLAPITLNTWIFYIEAAPAIFTAFDILDTSVRVTNVTVNSAIVRWTTSAPVLDTDARVNYDTDTGYGLSEDEGITGTDSFTVHTVTLSGLTAGTKYFFQVYSENSLAVSDTYYGTFVTEFSGSNPGSAVRDSGGDNKYINLVQSTDSTGIYDGSSYVVWENGGDVYGYFLEPGGTSTWTADGDLIDSNGYTNIRAFSDGNGYAIVTMEDGTDIYAKIIYDNSGSIAFISEWGDDSSTGTNVASGNNASAVALRGNPGINNIDGDSITGVSSSSAGGAVVFASTNYFFDFTQDLSLAAIDDGDLIIDTTAPASTTASTTVTNFASQPYIHALQQTVSRVTAGDTYVVADNDTSSLNIEAENHDRRATNTDTVTATYTSTGTNVYTLHNTTAPAWLNLGDVIYDQTNTVYGRLTADPATLTYTQTQQYTGSTTGQSSAPTNIIVDTGAFASMVGTNTYVAENMGTGECALITSIDSADQLTMSDYIFTTAGSETYNIYQINATAYNSDTNSTDNGANDSYLEDNDGFLSSPDNNWYSDSVAVDDIVHDTTDNTYARITTLGPRYLLTNHRSYLDLSFPIFATGTDGYEIFDWIATTISGGTTEAGAPTDRLMDTGAPFAAGVLNMIALNPSSEYAKVTDYISSSELGLARSLFDSNGQTYYIYSGEYCDLHLEDATYDAFDPFYNLGINWAITITDGQLFNLYDTIVAGTAIAPPTTPFYPLYDNIGTFATDSVADNDMVINTTNWGNPPNLARIDSTTAPAFAVYEHAARIDTDIFANGDLFEILNFNPDILNDDVIETGSVSGISGNEVTTANADFTIARPGRASGVEKGDLAYNITDDTYAVVTAQVSATTIELNRQIFAASDLFIIIRSDQSLIETGVVGSEPALNTIQDNDHNITGPRIGDIAVNQTTGTSSTIVSIPAVNRIELDSDIFTPGDRYIIVHPTILFVYENTGDILGTLMRLGDATNITDIALYNSTITMRYPHAVSDGQGGAFIIYETTSTNTIYGKHVDSTGAVSTGGASTSAGVSIATGTILDVRVVPNGTVTNRVYILYENAGTTYLTRRNATLTDGDASTWTITISTTGTDAVLALDSSGDPDPILAYVDANANIVANKYDASADGALLYTFTIPTGTNLYTPASTILSLSITGDENGGAILAWIDDRYYTNTGLAGLSQAFDATLTPAWDNDSDAATDFTGILISILSSTDDQDAFIKTIFYNDGGTPYGALYLWQDYRNAQTDIFYDRMAR